MKIYKKNTSSLIAFIYITTKQIQEDYYENKNLDSPCGIYPCILLCM